MHQIFDNIKYIVGDREVLSQMADVPVLPLFSDKVLDFFDVLSKKLLHDRLARRYPDIIAYAFWIRRASMEKVRQRYRSDTQKLGRGIAFQIAPSNIPVQFAVSMTYALTAGNICIVRISNKEFEQVDIICNIMRDVIENECEEMKPYICVIRYEHNDEITQKITDISDIRMIWGGDHTVSTIRKQIPNARCIDLGFADRYSIGIIDSDEYLQKDPVILANDFYNDTYFSDQNACSSPRLLIWIGTRIAEAKEQFWTALEKIVLEKYSLEPICSSEKLLNTAICAAVYPDIKQIKKDNLLVRVELPILYKDIMDYKGNCGYFFEYSAKDLQEIVPILKRECQTITYVGNLELKLRQIIELNGVKGVDRIVPFGHAGDIVFVWDGFDLPNILSRQVSNL